MESRISTLQKGFTLVEMALVLVIIGLILGAVSIGMDLQRTSEYNKVKQKFVDQWAHAYNQYYTRAGVVLGDDPAVPTMAINGDIDQFQDLLLDVTDGNYANVDTDAAGRICQGPSNDAYVGNRDASSTHDAGSGDVTVNSQNLHGYFDRLGIRMPPGRAEGREDRYVYLDSNGNPQEIQICFQWNPPGTVSNAGNVMVISGLTPDLARMLDEMIDGQANALSGAFREQGRADDGNANWTFSNVDAFGTTASDAGTGTVRDEDQIITVTAHYKMNQ